MTPEQVTKRALTPEEMTAAANALTAATQAEAEAAGQQTEGNLAELAPGLSSGSNAPGGLNYQRGMAAVVPTLTAQYLTTARQAALRGAVRDSLNKAQVEYDTAKSAYQERQRAFNVKQAEKARERQREAERRAAAAARAARYGGGGGAALAPAGGGAGGVAGVNITPTKQYIGNDDWRGHLAWLAQNGNQNARIALQYVGNDNKFYQAPESARAALEAVGATPVPGGGYYSPGGGGGGGFR